MRCLLWTKCVTCIYISCISWQVGLAQSNLSGSWPKREQNQTLKSLSDRFLPFPLCSCFQVEKHHTSLSVHVYILVRQWDSQQCCTPKSLCDLYRPLKRAAGDVYHDYVIHIHLRSNLQSLNDYGAAIESMFYTNLPQMDVVHTELCSSPEVA